MKNIILFSVLGMLSACGQPQAYAPTSTSVSHEELMVSRDRAKQLNLMERSQIQEWIVQQKEKFYPMTKNYWVNLPQLTERTKKEFGEIISYQYDLYDFDQVKLYDQPKLVQNVMIGKYDDLAAVNDVVKYLQKGEEATLLVPSVLAFGTYGDNKKIPNDMPVIIKIKML